MSPTDLTWPDVFYTLIIALPGIFAAFFSAKNARQLRTDNGKSVGKVLSDVQAIHEADPNKVMIIEKAQDAHDHPQL